MLLKKRLLCVGIASTIILGTLFISNADNDKNLILEYNEEVKLSFNKLLDSEGVEFVKVTYDNGQWIEIYRDLDNQFERVDFYASDGTLVTRDLTTDGGTSITTLGSDEGNYVATRLVQPKSVANENSELLKISMIDSFFTTDVMNGLELDWKLANFQDDKLYKYTSENGNIYIDKETKELVKREVIFSGEIIQTIEYDKLNNQNNKSLDGIFSINAPLSTDKARKSIDFSSITVKDFNVEDDEFYSDDPNPVG